MDFKKIAREILANVGNEENIKDVIHCHTRLRFSLIDSDKVNKDNLSKIEGVITVVESMDQLQVVIGSNVDKVYKELEKMLGKTTDVSNNEVTGCTVTMNLGDGYKAIYGQLKEVSKKAGDYVAPGEVIGYISEPTKYYSEEGSNLYFELQKDDQPVDPMGYFK